MRPQSFSLASSRADVLALWPWNCTAARWEPWLSNIRWRPWSSFQGQNQIFLSAAPVQGRKEILGIRRGKRGRREQQSSLVWTDSRSWKPVFERYIAQFKGKVETKRWPWGCFPVDGGYVGGDTVSAVLAAAFKHTTQWHCLWMQSWRRAAGSREISSMSPESQLEKKEETDRQA